MGKGTKTVTEATELITSLRDLRLALESLILRKYFRDSFSLPLKRTKPPSLVSLCLEILGQNLEDIIADISKIAAVFPSDIKLALVAIARRRQLLNDDLLVALAEVSWNILDIYGSNVTDYGLKKVAEICTNLQAVDISHCDKITATGVSGLICHCQSLEILRWGGSPRSDSTAFRCVDILKPKLNNVEEESWEELENADIGSGAPSLRWLVWPNIDEVSKAIMAAECPQIIVNPPDGFPEVPNEALDFVALDYSIIDGIDPKTWDVSGTARSSAPKLTVSNGTFELFIADFLKRRATLVPKQAYTVPKQAIYARQNKRRAKREYLMSSSSPKSIMRASQASKFLHHRR